MKAYQWIAVALCLVLVLAGCTPALAWETPAADRAPGMDDQEVTLPYTFEYTSEEDDSMRQGKLIVTVNRCWTVTNETDIPLGGGFKNDDVTRVIFQDLREDGTYEILSYPEDVVQEDGSFVAGAYFVMIELTYTNVDAARWTRDDKNEKGERLGMFSDPYVFDMIGGLQYPGSQGSDTNYDYFSALGEVEDDMDTSHQFYLEPGETRTVTVGFLVRENRDTCLPYTLSDLSYRISLDGGYTQVFIPLGE